MKKEWFVETKDFGVMLCHGSTKEKAVEEYCKEANFSEKDKMEKVFHIWEVWSSASYQFTPPKPKLRLHKTKVKQGK